MKKRNLILILIGIIILVTLIVFLKKPIKITAKECVPASCCHADNCVLKENAPNCSNIMCTMECSENTMDCGKGSCGFVKGNCEVIWDE